MIWKKTYCFHKSTLYLISQLGLWFDRKPNLEQRSTRNFRPPLLDCQSKRKWSFHVNDSGGIEFIYKYMHTYLKIAFRSLIIHHSDHLIDDPKLVFGLGCVSVANFCFGLKRSTLRSRYTKNYYKDSRKIYRILEVTSNKS